MLSMKTNLIIALAIGALISTTLLVLEPLTDFAFLGLELPGISVAYLFWGATGGSTFAGTAIALIVNALAYGLGAFVILSALGALVRANAPRTSRP